MHIRRSYIYLAVGVVFLIYHGIKYLLGKRQERRTVYSVEELELYEKHLETNWGPVKSVFHETSSDDDMHIDIYIVKPTEKYPYYTLFTCGMGAKKMPLPEKAAGKMPDRIELMLTLPPDWQFNEVCGENEKYDWPIGLLRYLSRFPWEEATWLGWGHTIQLTQFAENTKMESVFLNYPENYPFEIGHIDFAAGRTVQFVNVVPVYKEEMDYKLTHGPEALEKLLGDSLYAPIDPNRKNFAVGNE